jgi:thiol:disulfide interchange protein
MIEAVGLCVAAVFAGVLTATGKSSDVGAGIGLTVLALGTAAGLAAIAVGLDRARPWSRTPAALTQFFVIIAGVVLLDGHRPEWGVPALVLAAASAAGLLTPASLRALNRPPVTPQKSR